MEKIDPSIFKAYDIRGNTKTSLTRATAQKIGLALGTYMKKQQQTTAVVGHDNRLSSPILKEALYQGILLTGVNVIDIGQVITPVLYYSQQLLGIGSGVMVTGSHNPPEDNGFKIVVGSNNLVEQQIVELSNIINTENFEFAKAGKYESLFVTASYLNMLKSKISLGPRRLKIVVDAGNGTASDFAPVILSDLGCEVIPLFCESDPTFPNHHPDPVLPANLNDLQEKVLETGADLGVAYDGDGDRLGVVDERGNILWGDQLMILFWREILPRFPQTPVLIEVKCSQALIDEVTRLGGNPVFTRTGHSLIKNLMKKNGSVFTGEMSGHMFFADEYYGFDDAIYATLRLLRILSQTNLPLSSLLADTPRYFATPETRVVCPNEQKFHIIEELKRELSTSYPLITIDGIRLQFPDGWGLIRASNTESVLVLRAEAKSPEKLTVIKCFLKSLLKNKLPQSKLDW